MVSRLQPVTDLARAMQQQHPDVAAVPENVHQAFFPTLPPLHTVKLIFLLPRILFQNYSLLHWKRSGWLPF